MKICVNAGFSLIEVLITMMILAIGLLGLAGLQARAHNAESESFSRAQALILAYDMADRLAANRVEAKKGAASAYDTTVTLGTGNPAAVCNSAPTSSVEVAQADLCEWDLSLKGATQTLGGASTGSLAAARGCVDYVAAAGAIPQSFAVTVAWAGRGAIGTVAADRTCGSTAITLGRRIVSVTVPLADLDN